MNPRALAVAVALAAVRAYGSGLELVEQGPAGVGTAGAQAADAYGAAAAYYDPAALAFQRGLTVMGGADAGWYRAAVAPATSGRVDLAGSFAAPAVFVGQRVSARYAVGIGVYAPYGWAAAAGTTSVALRTTDVNPSIAIRPLPWVALGFGVDIMPTTFAQAGPNLAASGVGLGGNAGLLVRALPRWLDLALTYRSAMDVDLAHETARATVHGILPLPHAFTFAAASHPVDGLTLTADVRLTLWHDLQALAFAAPAAMPSDVLTFDWQDTVGVRVGAAWATLPDADGEPRLTLRVGGGWEQSPTERAVATGLFADGDRGLIGAGLGARWGVATLDVAYLAAVMTPYTSAYGAADSARNSGVTHVVSVALTLRLPTFPRRLDEPDYKR
jgi:long-chain fatty acid transport protein